jgi:uncharacterized sulfatase
MLLAFLAGLYLSPSAFSAQPNFIMVFIDDMGWGDFSCFGNRDAKTPNVDRMAAEGIRFSQFYVNSPICSPSLAVSTIAALVLREGGPLQTSIPTVC